jgi:predicted RNA-binding Zn ribbon-like protein
VSRRRPPQYDLPNPAPQPLRIVQKLLNSRDAEHGHEWLATAAALERWLAEQGLPTTRVRAGDLSRVVAVREALRSLALTNNGVPLDATAARMLELEARRAPLAVSFPVGGRAELTPAATGIDAALGRIFAIVHDAMLDDTWGRLKACKNCHWSFYDKSKNRSATWCSMELCGNRLKTKRYRSRRSAR